MALRLYNTLMRQKEDFVPVKEGEVGIYACGVTVYDTCHVGHARSAINFDVITRYLRYIGYKVTYVKNFTDIDDKIIAKANKEGVEFRRITERYIAEHEIDHPWTTEDRIIVCVRAGDVATKLVRRGYRLAKRFQGHFYVLHVKTPGQVLGSHRKELDRLFDLTRELGGEPVERDGDSVATEVLRFAAEVRGTFIVLGQSRRSRMDEVLHGSALVAKIMRGDEHVDILVVADPSKAHDQP